jgi:hypothetical protein
VAAQLHFEHLAAAHPSPFVRAVAGALALAGLQNLRGMEALRSSFLSGPSGPLDDKEKVVCLRCDAGKGETDKKMIPFDTFGPPEGYLGVARG